MTRPVHVGDQAADLARASDACAPVFDVERRNDEGTAEDPLIVRDPLIGRDHTHLPSADAC